MTYLNRISKMHQEYLGSTAGSTAGSTVLFRSAKLPKDTPHAEDVEYQ